MCIFSSLNSAILATFGESVTFTPAGGDATAITGVVSTPSNLPDAWPGIYHGLMILASALATAPAKGDGVTIGTTDYVVIDARADGSGAYFLTLEKA